MELKKERKQKEETGRREFRLREAVRIPIIVLGAVAGGLILSFVYVYLLAFLGSAVLRLLTLAGILAGASAWMVLLLQWGQVRKEWQQLLFVGIELLILYYNKWVLYTNLVEDAWFIGMDRLWEYHFALPDYLFHWAERWLHPQVLIQMMGEILYRGFLSINGQVLKGGLLGAVWAAEAAVLLGLPLLLVRSRMKVPYDEKAHLWLNREEERVVTYVKDYRNIRRKMQEEGPEQLRLALPELQPCRPEGKESYGVLTFFRNGDHIGPYISLGNVRTVQTGPRRTQRQYVQLGEKTEIGREEARALYQRICSAAEEGTLWSRLTDEARELWSRLVAMTAGVRSRLRGLRKEKTNATTGQPDSMKPMELENGEEVVNLEDITIFVPRITKEMEEEYRRKSK